MKQIPLPQNMSGKKALVGALISLLFVQPFLPLTAFADQTAQNLAPAAPQITNAPGTGEPNTSYDFTAVSTDPEGDQVNYGFDWDNDGSIDEYTGFVNSGTSGQLSHSWPADGTYTYSVSAKDINGNFSSPTQGTITISTPSGGSTGGSTGGSGSTGGASGGSSGTGSSGGSSSGGTQNTSPNQPNIVTPPTGLPNIPQTFGLSAIDPQGDQVSYGIDWDNNGSP